MSFEKFLIKNNPMIVLESAKKTRTQIPRNP